jgi:hypothetical protein
MISISQIAGHVDDIRAQMEAARFGTATHQLQTSGHELEYSVYPCQGSFCAEWKYVVNEHKVAGAVATGFYSPVFALGHLEDKLIPNTVGKYGP